MAEFNLSLHNQSLYNQPSSFLKVQNESDQISIKQKEVRRKGNNMNVEKEARIGRLASEVHTPAWGNLSLLIIAWHLPNEYANATPYPYIYHYQGEENVQEIVLQPSSCVNAG